jgi:hypothetical protein
MGIHRLPNRVVMNDECQRTTDCTHNTDDAFLLGRKLCRASVSDANSRWIGFSEGDVGHGQRVGDNAFHPAINYQLSAIDYQLLPRRNPNGECRRNVE